MQVSLCLYEEEESGKGKRTRCSDPSVKTEEKRADCCEKRYAKGIP